MKLVIPLLIGMATAGMARGAEYTEPSFFKCGPENASPKHADNQLGPVPCSFCTVFTITYGDADGEAPADYGDKERRLQKEIAVLEEQLRKAKRKRPLLVTTENSMANVSGDPVIDRIDSCAKENLERAQDASAAPPKYSTQAIRYFYDGLAALHARGVTLTAGSGALSFQDEMFRRHLGEWLYFTTPSFIDDGKPPDDDSGVDLPAFAQVQAYTDAEGGFIVFYWDYDAASNSVTQAVRLSERGLTPLQSETFEEKGKPLTVDPVANFNDFLFDPKTGTLTSTASDGADRIDVAYYQLEGDVFRLLRLDAHRPDGRSKVLYKRRG